MALFVVYKPSLSIFDDKNIAGLRIVACNKIAR